MPDEPRVKDFYVIAAAWPAICMFQRVQTQWRMSGGAVIGLDYVAVRWMFELYNVTDQKQLLDDLQVIEGKVIEIMNDRKK